MPLIGEAKHEIKIIRMKTAAGLEYNIQVERPNGVVSISAKGISIPFGVDDLAELWDVTSKARLWISGEADNPMVPRV